MWRVENRGKNLIEEFIHPLEKDEEIFKLGDWKYLFPAYPSSSATTSFAKAWLRRGVTYTIKLYLARVPSSAVRIMLVLMRPTGVFDYAGPAVLSEGWNAVQYIASESGVHQLLLWLNTTSGPVELYYPMVYEGTEDLPYAPPLQKSLESSLELFGYGGVYDEIISDGLVVKRWKRAGSLTVMKIETDLTNVYRIWLDTPEGARAYNFFSNDVMLKADGVPLPGVANYFLDEEHWYGASGGLLVFISTSTIDAEPGATLTEKAQSYVNKMTYIYQLATPEIQKLEYTGELILYPGKNYLVTDSKAPIAISIKGPRKYLEG